MAQNFGDSNALQVLDELLAARKAEAGFDDDSEYFEVFVAENVLRSFHLEDSEIQRGIVDTGDDGQVDAVYLFVNGALIEGDVTPSDLEPYRKDVVIDWVLLQASTEKGFKEKKVDRITKTLRDALNLSLSDPELTAIGYNKEVVAAIARFRETRRILGPTFPVFNVNVFYGSRGTTANIHPKVQVGATGLETLVREALPANVNCKFTFLGPRRLVQIASQPPKTTRALKYDTVLPSGQGNCICLVKLGDYYEFITENDEMLYHIFEANVRDYAPDADVNKDIRETLLKPPGEDFWCLNNGITVIVDNARVEEQLIASEPRIVNGLQTSEEIFAYYRAHKAQADPRRVMVRIIKSQSAESEDRIIRATNRQTAITSDQLHATEEVHRDIEKLLPSQGLYYDRRKNYRKYRDKPRTQVVGIKELAQACLAIYSRRPDTARARPGQVFGKSDAQVALYKSIFPGGTDAHPVGMYALCALLQKRVDQMLRRRRVEYGVRQDVRFYVSMYASALMAKKAVPTAADLAALNQEPGAIQEDILNEALNMVVDDYVSTKAIDSAAKGPELVTALANRLRAMFPTGQVLLDLAAPARAPSEKGS